MVDIDSSEEKNHLCSEDEIGSLLLVELEKQNVLALVAAQAVELHAEKFIFKQSKSVIH